MNRRLVPLGVLVVALLLLWWTSSSSDQGPLDEMESDVRTCTDNLLAIYDGIREYDERFGHPPSGSGVAFFAELVESGIWKDAPGSVARLTCPGPNAHPVPDGTSFAVVAGLTSASSAYAGRNMKDHPLEQFPSGGPDVQALVACDNANGSNHDGITNVLYSDRTVKTFEVEKLRERGVLSEDTDVLRIGPNSPLTDVRKLIAD